MVTVIGLLACLVAGVVVVLLFLLFQWLEETGILYIFGMTVSLGTGLYVFCTQIAEPVGQAVLGLF